jgi:serine/threonine protein kinase
MMLTSAHVADKGAAAALEGLTLLGKWNVQQRVRNDDGMTGGSRSACYRATNQNGDIAFVKAFDFRWQDLAGNTDLLEKMVREYNYEKNVHHLCRDHGVTRVTRIIDSGTITIKGEAVHFLICEWADKCLREHQPPGEKGISASDRFAALRDTASALSQLHKVGVAHQDIKPSNAVCAKDGLVKLTDLGSSSSENLISPPHDLEMFAGQVNYAPYELLYENPPTTWQRRRFGCDLFLLGNLCFTSFVGDSLTYWASHLLPNHLRHTEFAGDYAEVLPHLIELHEEIIPDFIEGTVPDKLKIEVVQLITCLCHPDPSLRGHSKNLQFHNNQFGLERFITKFDVLAKKTKVIQRGIH